MTLHCEDMFDTLREQGYPRNIATKGLCSVYCDVTLFACLSCNYVHHIDMVIFVILRCCIVFQIVTLLCSSHCNINIFVTLQHSYVHHIATLNFVHQIATSSYVCHMTKFLCVKHITKR
jgi:hypothetical protein